MTALQLFFVGRVFFRRYDGWGWLRRGRIHVGHMVGEVAVGMVGRSGAGEARSLEEIDTFGGIIGRLGISAAGEDVETGKDDGAQC